MGKVYRLGKRITGNNMDTKTQVYSADSS